jgi:hypothetical protein
MVALGADGEEIDEARRLLEDPTNTISSPTTCVARAARDWVMKKSSASGSVLRIHDCAMVRGSAGGAGSCRSWRIQKSRPPFRSLRHFSFGTWATRRGVERGSSMLGAAAQGRGMGLLIRKGGIYFAPP